MARLPVRACSDNRARRDVLAGTLGVSRDRATGRPPRRCSRRRCARPRPTEAWARLDPLRRRGPASPRTAAPGSPAGWRRRTSGRRRSPSQSRCVRRWRRPGRHPALVTPDRGCSPRASAPKLARWGVVVDDSGRDEASPTRRPASSRGAVPAEAAGRALRAARQRRLALLQHPAVRLGMTAADLARGPCGAGKIGVLRGGTREPRPGLAGPRRCAAPCAGVENRRRLPRPASPAAPHGRGLGPRAGGAGPPARRPSPASIRNPGAPLSCVGGRGVPRGRWVAAGAGPRPPRHGGWPSPRPPSRTPRRASIRSRTARQRGPRHAVRRPSRAPDRTRRWRGTSLHYPGFFCLSLCAPAPQRRRGRAETAHPRLKILGLLEARPDQGRSDRGSGGLDEGVWPPAGQDRPVPQPGRHARGDRPRAPPERRLGQTAHDLVQALGAAGRGG